MRKICLVCALLISLMIVGSATRSEAVEATGKIDQINTKFSTLVIMTDNDGFQVLATDDKTSFTNKVGKLIKFAELKKGDYVSIVYDTVRNGNNSRNMLKSVKTSEENKQRRGR